MIFASCTVVNKDTDPEISGKLTVTAVDMGPLRFQLISMYHVVRVRLR